METKNYIKDENFTILWTPSKCIHAGVCVKQLPKVYNPKARPWITPEYANIEDIKAQIDKCPSGALGYESKI